MINKDLRQAVALLAAGDWQGAHAIVQEDEESRLSCWAHGIVHLMEGRRRGERALLVPRGRTASTLVVRHEGQALAARPAVVLALD